MAYGIETYRANGSKMLSGLSKGGVLIDVLTITGGQSLTKAYPRTNSPGALSYSVARPGGHKVSLISQLGQGAVKVDVDIGAPQTDTTLYVFASNLTNSDQYGIQMVNDAGEVLADQGFPSPQYAGNVLFSSVANLKYATPDGYTVHVHTSTAFNLRPTSDKIVLINMPDSGTDDTWYSIDRECILANAGAVTVTLRVFTKAASYAVPSLHVYALNNPVDSGALWAVKLYDSSGQLTFDSNSEGLNNTASQPVTITGYGTTTTYDIALPSNVGVSIPYYYQSKTSGPNVQRYMGAAKRVGSQLTYTQMYESQVQLDPIYGSNNDYTVGGTLQRYTPVADLSQVSPSTAAGTPASTTSSYPVINTEPADVWGPLGTAKTLSVSASGTALTYQWYRQRSGESTWTSVAGATSSAYTFTPASADDLEYFYCAVSNALGTINSIKARYYVDTSSGPTITAMSPAANTTMTVNPGDSVTVSFSASGSPAPNCQISLSGSVVGTGSGSASYTFTAVAGTTYNFTMTATVVAEHISHVTSQSTTVRAPTVPDHPVQIVSSPASTTVQAGNTASFTVTVSGDSPYYYTWFKNGQGIGAAHSQSSSTSNTLSFTATSADNGASIYCAVNNHASGETFLYEADSSAATLTVTSSPASPVISSQPSNVTVTQNSSATFSVTASPATSYQWYRNGTAISGATGSSVSANTATTGTFTYYCIVYNSTSSTQSSSATLTVNPPAAATFPYYYDFSGEIDDYYGNNVEFDIFRGGGTSTGDWAGGSGDGTLYDVKATASFTPASGSFALNTWYSLATYSGVGWIMSGGGGITRTLSVQVRLRSTGAIVSSGSITLYSVSNGGVPP